MPASKSRSRGEEKVNYVEEKHSQNVLKRYYFRTVSSSFLVWEMGNLLLSRAKAKLSSSISATQENHVGIPGLQTRKATLRHWQASVHTQYNIYLGIKCLSSVWLAVFLLRRGQQCADVNRLSDRLPVSLSMATSFPPLEEMIGNRLRIYAWRRLTWAKTVFSWRARRAVNSQKPPSCLNRWQARPLQSKVSLERKKKCSVGHAPVSKLPPLHHPLECLLRHASRPLATLPILHISIPQKSGSQLLPERRVGASQAQGK